MLKHAAIHTPRCSRRFGIPAEHYHKSFLTNSIIRLSISNLLCGRNAAPPTIANWHAIAYFHADEGTQASLPATRLEDAPCEWRSNAGWPSSFFDSWWFWPLCGPYIREIREIRVRKKINRLLTPLNLNFFSSWVEQPNNRFGLKWNTRKLLVGSPFYFS